MVLMYVFQNVGRLTKLEYDRLRQSSLLSCVGCKQGK